MSSSPLSLMALFMPLFAGTESRSTSESYKVSLPFKSIVGFSFKRQYIQDIRSLKKKGQRVPRVRFFKRQHIHRTRMYCLFKKMEGFQTTQLDILFFNSLFSTLFIKISIPDQDKNVRRDLKYKVVSIPLFRPKVDILSFKKKLQQRC